MLLNMTLQDEHWWTFLDLRTIGMAMMAILSRALNQMNNDLFEAAFFVRHYELSLFEKSKQIFPIDDSATFLPCRSIFPHRICCASRVMLTAVLTSGLGFARGLMLLQPCLVEEGLFAFSAWHIESSRFFLVLLQNGN